MIVPRIFRSACTHALTAPRLVLTLYSVNFLLAFPAFIISYSLLGRALDHSLAGESLLSRFDYTLWSDLLSSRGFSLGILIPLAISLAIVAAAVQTFLAGGVLDLLAHEKRFSATSFFRACGTYFGRFLRIWLLTALVLLLTFMVLGTLLGIIVGAVSLQYGSERVTLLAAIFALVFFSLPVLLIFMASDYARVSMVVHDGRSTLKAIGRGVWFVLRNAWSTLGLHLLLLLLLSALVALYLVLEGCIEIDRSSAIALIFLLQQLFLLGRTAIRVAFSAGEVTLYEERKPRPVVFYGWDDSPVLPGY
jgi:hypothetical protein